MTAEPERAAPELPAGVTWGRQLADRIRARADDRAAQRAIREAEGLTRLAAHPTVRARAAARVAQAAQDAGTAAAGALDRSPAISRLTIALSVIAALLLLILLALLVGGVGVAPD